MQKTFAKIKDVLRCTVIQEKINACPVIFGLKRIHFFDDAISFDFNIIVYLPQSGKGQTLYSWSLFALNLFFLGLVLSGAAWSQFCVFGMFFLCLLLFFWYPCLLFPLPGWEQFYCSSVWAGSASAHASSPRLNKLECDVCVLFASLAVAIVSATVYELKLAAVLRTRYWVCFIGFFLVPIAARVSRL